MEDNTSNLNTNSHTSLKKYLPAVLIVFSLLLVIGLAVTRNKNNPADVNPTLSPANETTLEADDQTNPNPEGTVQEFNVKGSNYKFDIAEIKVKKGDTVKITVTNTEGMHDFVLDEFDAKTKILKEGDSETIEFVADQSGNFEYYCSVGSHRAMGMKGTLTVE